MIEMKVDTMVNQYYVKHDAVDKSMFRNILSIHTRSLTLCTFFYVRHRRSNQCRTHLMCCENVNFSLHERLIAFSILFLQQPI